MRRDEKLAYIVLATSGILWGASFVLGKIALQELDVSHMILYRFAFASLAFVPLLVWSRPRFAPREWPGLVLIGVVGVPVQFLMQFEGLARTTASHAALMIGLAPVLVAAGGFIVFRERLRGIAWAALVASTAGVAMIVLGSSAAKSGSSQPTAVGDLLVLLSMFAATAWVLASKHLMEEHSAIAVSGVIVIVGSVALAAWVLAVHGAPPTHLSTRTWMSVAALGVVMTTCTTALWNWGLSHTDAGKAGAFINLEPVVGAALGVWLLHETLGGIAIAGGALIVAGALLVTRSEKR